MPIILDGFERKLRSRDTGCVISQISNRTAHLDIWAGFEGAHVWPLHKGQEWVDQGLHRWITDTGSQNPDLRVRINSPQNGMILGASVHALFDKYLCGIDPDVSTNALMVKLWID